MKEEDYIEKLKSLWPTEQGIEASLDTIALADKAVEAYPFCAQLWCIRGDLIQLGPENCPHELGEALSSYKRAMEIDSTCAEAYESIGYFLDAVKGKHEEAEHYFKEAAKRQ